MRDPSDIPEAFEDKVLQRAVAMELEAVYEQSFLDCSYGFRTGRSLHQGAATGAEPDVEAGGQVGAGVGISGSSSTAWTIVSCGTSCASGYVTECCCGSSASG